MLNKLKYILYDVMLAFKNARIDVKVISIINSFLFSFIFSYFLWLIFNFSDCTFYMIWRLLFIIILVFLWFLYWSDSTSFVVRNSFVISLYEKFLLSSALQSKILLQKQYNNSIWVFLKLKYGFLFENGFYLYFFYFILCWYPGVGFISDYILLVFISCIYTFFCSLYYFIDLFWGFYFIYVHLKKLEVDTYCILIHFFCYFIIFFLKIIHCLVNLCFFCLILYFIIIKNSYYTYFFILV